MLHNAHAVSLNWKVELIQYSEDVGQVSFLRNEVLLLKRSGEILHFFSLKKICIFSCSSTTRVSTLPWDSHCAAAWRSNTSCSAPTSWQKAWIIHSRSNLVDVFYAHVHRFLQRRMETMSSKRVRADEGCNDTHAHLVLSLRAVRNHSISKRYWSSFSAYGS